MSNTVSGNWNSAAFEAEQWHNLVRSSLDRGLMIIGTAIAFISVIFTAFPVLDLAISHIFADGHSFFLGEYSFLRGVRDLGRQGQPYILGCMALLIALYVLVPKLMAFCPPHKPLFVLLSFAAGPLVIVQTLKVLIGRARPREIVEFGGGADFTPVWHFSAACTHNCSFPSGESAVAAAALSLLVFVPAKIRLNAALVLTPFLLLIAFNRVFFGAHFVSDVMLAWLLTMFAMLCIWRWIEARSSTIDRFLAKLC